MNTIKHNGKDVPVVHAEVKVTIKNQKTGVIYKTEEEWKALNIPVEDIQQDVLVKVPKLDLFAKTKQVENLGRNYDKTTQTTIRIRKLC